MRGRVTTAAHGAIESIGDYLYNIIMWPAAAKVAQPSRNRQQPGNYFNYRLSPRSYDVFWMWNVYIWALEAKIIFYSEEIECASYVTWAMVQCCKFILKTTVQWALSVNWTSVLLTNDTIWVCFGDYLNHYLHFNSIRVILPSLVLCYYYMYKRKNYIRSHCKQTLVLVFVLLVHSTCQCSVYDELPIIIVQLFYPWDFNVFVRI